MENIKSWETLPRLGLEVKKIFEDRNLNLFGSFNDLGGRERCLIFHKKKKV